jgi:hypothetical protein
MATKKLRSKKKPPTSARRGAIKSSPNKARSVRAQSGASHPFARIIKHTAALGTETPKWLAVAAAVAQQLRDDGHWPVDPSRTMAQNGYGENELRTFLEGVRRKLAPDYKFDFDDTFVKKGLGQTIGELTDSIDAQTA